MEDNSAIFSCSKSSVNIPKLNLLLIGNENFNSCAQQSHLNNNSEFNCSYESIDNYNESLLPYLSPARAPLKAHKTIL